MRAKSGSENTYLANLFRAKNGSALSTADLPLYHVAMARPDQDFRTFYYTKVGLGEGCGCAERIIDIHEADRKAGTPLTLPARAGAPLSQRLRLTLNALGLTRRPPRA